MYEPYEVYEFWITFSFCCLNLFHGEEKHHPIILHFTYQLCTQCVHNLKLENSTLLQILKPDHTNIIYRKVYILTKDSSRLDSHFKH
jgi:hypothetical protein